MKSNPQKSVTEKERTLPVTGSYDVVVAGSGPAGVGAALAAARQGAETLLVETHGCLGGVWTSGLLSWVIDAHNKTGLIAEISEKLDARSARVIKGTRFAYDVEEMKLLLEELCAEAGVAIRLHTRVAAAHRKGRLLKGIVTESRSGREAFEGKAFIDCTGDGDLAALAGCSHEYGHPETGKAQPMSLVALITGVRAAEIAPFIGGADRQAKINLHQEFLRAGVTPSYGGPTLFRVRDDFFALVANHEYNVSPMNADEVTRATLRARRELHRLIRALRKLGNPWKDLRIVATGEQIGIREGRRIAGRYLVSLEDLLTGARHPDAVCRVTAGIDIHSIDPSHGTQASKDNKIRTQPYDIPLRALLAREVDGLMMAGRCISGDFFAHSSYRMTGNAVVMGEAAGVTAAIAASSQRLPHEVGWPEIARQLHPEPEEVSEGATLAGKA
ncbi:MAG TPA: FAD-dependent oxidoreductase [Chthoniobacteraceae bacterium]|nr:FAD-dependent oxidoreductase [Chthoniobacteraceae bacterium]